MFKNKYKKIIEYKKGEFNNCDKEEIEYKLNCFLYTSVLSEFIFKKENDERKHYYLKNYNEDIMDVHIYSNIYCDIIFWKLLIDIYKSIKKKKKMQLYIELEEVNDTITYKNENNNYYIKINYEKYMTFINRLIGLYNIDENCSLQFEDNLINISDKVVEYVIKVSDNNNYQNIRKIIETKYNNMLEINKRNAMALQLKMENY